MVHEYSAENHDWDLTLRAAFDLLQVGRIMNQRPRTGTMSMGFSAFTGSMLLSFAAIESFSASVAFSMPQTPKFKEFNFEAYRCERTFWGKIEMLFTAIGHKVDRSAGMFQTITDMQRWRNLVTHASPYRIDNVKIENTTTAVRRLHKPRDSQQYTRIVDEKNATKFYQTACDYITFLKENSGIEPHAQAVYLVGG